MKDANDVPLAGDAESEKQAPLLQSAGAAVYAGEQQPKGERLVTLTCQTTAACSHYLELLQYRAGNSMHAAWHFLTMASTSDLYASSYRLNSAMCRLLTSLYALAQIPQPTLALHICHTGEALWQLNYFTLLEPQRKPQNPFRAGLLPLRSLWSSTLSSYTAPISSPQSTSWTACGTTGDK